MNAAETPHQRKVRDVTGWLTERIIGQHTLLQRLMMALLCGGHLLVEGAPGLAKTRAVKELANAVEGDFHRIQFTPDLLPSDITGAEVFRPEDECAEIIAFLQEQVGSNKSESKDHK